MSSWYKIENIDTSKTFQGDLLKDVIVSNVLEKKRMKVNAVILNQSCDLVNKISDDKPVTLAILVGLKEYLNDLVRKGNGVGEKALKKEFEALNRNHIHNLFVLDKCNDEFFDSDYMLAVFTTLFVIKFGDLKEQIKTNNILKARLKSPYREKLTHQFAHSYSRVALDNDLENPDNDYYKSIISK